MFKYIFRVEVEVEPMEGTTLPTDTAGAFVNVYVGANHIRDAIEKVETQLLKDCYKPVYTYAAYEMDLDNNDYDTNEEGYPNNKDLIKIQESRTMWYSPFNCFPPEEKEIH
ncbi:MAG: hypothetical protein KZQ94_04095 [Candidatus Thiodiazotropha sp. (ex Troendleina suluensis)]|nr:hypothetical protein [Candidatus Thiodiazotropha sp. (ex Troendleina suluensis)]